MRPRTFWSLFVLAWLLAFLLLFLETRPSGHSYQAPQAVFVFPTLSHTNVKQIILTSGVNQVQLDRYPVGWKMRYRVGQQILAEDRADEEMIQTLLQELKDLQSKQPPQALEASSLSLYGLGDNDYRHLIQVHYGQMQRTLQLGTAIPQQPLLYARWEKKTELLQVSIGMARWLQDLRQNPDGWRSRRLFHIQPPQIPRRWFWQLAGQNRITLVNQSGHWSWQESTGKPASNMLAKPSGIQKSADEKQEQIESNVWQDRASPDVCESLVQTAMRLRIQGFPREHPLLADLFQQYLMIGYHDGHIQEYIVIGPQVTSGNMACRYVAKAWLTPELEIGQVYLVPEVLVQFPVQSQAFLDPLILRNLPDLDDITIQRSGTVSWKLEPATMQTQPSSAIAPHQRTWNLTQPKLVPVDDNAVQPFWQELQQLQTQEFVKLEQPLSTPCEMLEIRWTPVADNPAWISPPTSPASAPPTSPASPSPPSSVAPALDSSSTILLQWHVLSDGTVLIRQSFDSLWRKLPQVPRILQSNHFQFYNRRVDAFIFVNVIEVKIQRGNRQYQFRKAKDEHWSEPVAALLRASAWIMADAVLGEETDRLTLGCQDDAPDCITIVSVPDDKPSSHVSVPDAQQPSQPIQRQLILGNRVSPSADALWVSGFPYVYQINTNFRTALDQLTK